MLNGRSDLSNLAVSSGLAGANTGFMDVTNFLQPEVVEVNRLPARQPLESFANVEQVRLGTSRFRRSLDGTWRFKLVDSPLTAPRRWQHPATNDSRWSALNVSTMTPMK